MAGRTSARTTASRDQASSPPTKSGQRVHNSQSPSLRPTRTTRSQSRDLDEVDTELRTRKTVRARAAREGSADSSGSAARKGKGRRKNARNTAAVPQDLSMVAEDQEPEQDVEVNPVGASDNPKVTQSPGAMSNLSGTTAHTAQSSQKMAEFDTGMIVELIPDLSREASQLLELLAPTNAPADFVETVVKELQVPGSGRGKRLRLREKTFDSTKENYTSDLFINIELVLGRIFNDQDPGQGNFRPDVILHKANLSVLVKELLVAQRDNPNTMDLLQRADNLFPMPFLSAFGNEPQFGVSSLLDSTLDIALDLRTQTCIAIFKVYRDELKFDPDELLAALFYEPPTSRNATLSPYEDLVTNGQIRKIGGISAEAVPAGGEEVVTVQAAKIRQRVDAIRETFYIEGDGIMDYVDFDRLHERFPWTAFLANVVRWSQARLEEIKINIEWQGGIESVTGLLVEKIKSLDSQVELYYEPPKVTKQAPQPVQSKAGLLPAATIIPASAGKSLYNSSRSLQALLKKPPPPTSSAPPSNQQHPRALLHNSRMPGAAAWPRDIHRPNSTEKETTPPRQIAPGNTAENLQDEGVNASDYDSDDGASSIAEVLSLHFEGETYNHKENRPLDHQQQGSGGGGRLKFIDPQPNAERVAWSFQSEDSDEREQTPPQRKRKRPATESEIEEGDDDFQIDDRLIQPPHRAQASITPPQPRRSEQPAQSPSKRPRTHTQSAETEEEKLAAVIRRREERRRLERQQEDRQAAHRARLEAEEEEERREREVAFQAKVRRDARDMEPEEEDEEVNNGPPMSYAAIKQTAQATTATLAAMRRPIISEPKRRQRWSESETQALIDLIGRYGCAWVDILQKGKDQFAEGRDQGALKDKARNVKVDYLIAGSMLPMNFNGIALGFKEREKVKRVGMNPYREEGENVGEENRDFDGNKWQ